MIPGFERTPHTFDVVVYVGGQVARSTPVTVIVPSQAQFHDINEQYPMPPTTAAKYKTAVDDKGNKIFNRMDAQYIADCQQVYNERTAHAAALALWLHEPNGLRDKTVEDVADWLLDEASPDLMRAIDNFLSSYLGASAAEREEQLEVAADNFQPGTSAGAEGVAAVGADA